MLTASVGRWARERVTVAPWSSGIGLARTVLALGTLGTLLATSPQVLLSRLAGGVVPPTCGGAARIGIWCVLPEGHGQLARLVSAAVLAVVASGWRPRFTAIPHWWVAWSVIANVTVQDGGDQITAILTLLLIPVLLTDPRRWHWSPGRESAGGTARRVIAYAALLLIQVQVAGLYFDAGVSKLGVTQWADGTAMFYWFHNVIFGAPGWIQPATNAVSDSPWLVALVTWGAVGLEITLGCAIVMPRPAKRALLAAGLLFHDGIALTMGLVSFDAAMTGALLLYLLPIGCQVPRPTWLRFVSARARAALPSPSRAGALASVAEANPMLAQPQEGAKASI